MKLPTKVGIAVLGLILLAAVIGFSIFYYNGPRLITKRVALLNESVRYEKVFSAGRELLKTFRGNDGIYPSDKRGDGIAAALAPVPYSYIALVGDKLVIECGGGFHHFGYEIQKRPDGTYLIAFVEDEKEPKILKIIAPNKVPQTSRMLVEPRAFAWVTPSKRLSDLYRWSK